MLPGKAVRLIPFNRLPGLSRFGYVFEFGPDAQWLDELAATELPPPPSGTRTWRVSPDRIIEARLRAGGTAVGKPVAWARLGPGWACLLIWACRRGGLAGPRPRARWGWYAYDPAGIRTMPDFYAGRPGASFAQRYLPGYEQALAEARAAFMTQRGHHS